MTVAEQDGTGARLRFEALSEPVVGRRRERRRQGRRHGGLRAGVPRDRDRDDRRPCGDDRLPRPARPFVGRAGLGRDRPRAHRQRVDRRRAGAVAGGDRPGRAQAGQPRRRGDRRGAVHERAAHRRRRRGRGPPPAPLVALDVPEPRLSTDVRRRRPPAACRLRADLRPRRPPAPRRRRGPLRNVDRPRRAAPGLRVLHLADGGARGRRPLRHRAAARDRGRRLGLRRRVEHAARRRVRELPGQERHRPRSARRGAREAVDEPRLQPAVRDGVRAPQRARVPRDPRRAADRGPRPPGRDARVLRADTGGRSTPTTRCSTGCTPSRPAASAWRC